MIARGHARYSYTLHILKSVKSASEPIFTSSFPYLAVTPFLLRSCEPLPLPPQIRLDKMEYAQLLYHHELTPQSVVVYFLVQVCNIFNVLASKQSV